MVKATEASIPSGADGPTLRQLSRGMWGIFRWVRGLTPARPTALRARVQRLEDEQAIRDLLSRYAYAYDAADLEGIMSVFTDDATNVTARGVYVGKEAIRRNYGFLVSRRRIAFHYTTNVTVKILEDGATAWTLAYFYAVGVTTAGTLYGVNGSYAHHMTKVAGEWKIAEQRVTNNFRHVMAAEPYPSMSAPPPTPTESTADWMEPQYTLL